MSHFDDMMFRRNLDRWITRETRDREPDPEMDFLIAGGRVEPDIEPDDVESSRDNTLAPHEPDDIPF